uniref:Uncharacterized protein n=1 Tax=Anguilla anguilla TaxID=7936 RepID=A0A0E9QFZ2_ANGAN
MYCPVLLQRVKHRNLIARRELLSPQMCGHQKVRS